MNKDNTIFISYTFYPIEGGIQTYLKNIAQHWDTGKVRVYTNIEKKVPDLLKEPLIIKRFSFGSKNYLSALIKIIRLLFKNKKSTYKKLKFLLLLMSSRSALKNIANFTLNVYRDLQKSDFKPKFIQCSLPIYTGLVGVVTKFIFGSRLVIYIHGKELIKYEKLKNIRNLQKFVFEYADIIISNSNYTKEKAVMLGAKSAKIKVVNLGADIDKFYPKNTKKKIYKKFDIPENHKLLYTISHLIPRKGNDMVIKSLPKVLQKYSNVTYLIGGRGKYKKELKRLVNENNLTNHVKFLDYIEEDDLNEIMNACDIFIMPNRQEGYDVEGYGIVFMEANACKKPVIGGNSGGVTDAIINGQTGLIVNPYSKENISKKILFLLRNDNLCSKMGKNGYELVLKKRNWETVSSIIHSAIINKKEE